MMTGRALNVQQLPHSWNEQQLRATESLCFPRIKCIFARCNKEQRRKADWNFSLVSRHLEVYVYKSQR